MEWQEIKSEIKRTLKEPEQNGHWSDMELLRRANLVQDEVARQTKCIVKDITLTGQIDENNIYFVRPADCVVISDIVYKGQRLFGTTEDELDAYFGKYEAWRQAKGEPKRYILEYRKIIPVPNPQSIDSVIELKYCGLADKMTNDNSQSFNGIDFIGDLGGQLIIDGVLFKCFLEDQNQIFATYKQLYNTNLLLLRDILRNDDAIESFGIARTIR